VLTFILFNVLLGNAKWNRNICGLGVVNFTTWG